eukprot:933305-Pleurochrysis_carterae.AAC.1
MHMRLLSDWRRPERKRRIWRADVARGAARGAAYSAAWGSGGRARLLALVAVRLLLLGDHLPPLRIAQQTEGANPVNLAGRSRTALLDMREIGRGAQSERSTTRG